MDSYGGSSMSRQFSKLIPLFFILFNSSVFSAGLKDESSLPMWSGFYVGLQAGSAWSDANVSTTIANNGVYFAPTDVAQVAAVGNKSLNSTDFIGGGQIGYNWQIKQWVVGVDAEMSSLSMSSAKSGTVEYQSFPGTAFTISSTSSSNWLLTLKAKVGYAVSRCLIYFTGGLADTNAKYNYQFSDTNGSGALENANVSENVGGAVGAGFDVKLATNWFINAEYLFMDFGQNSTTGVVQNTGSNPPAELAHNANLTVQTAMFGINYRF